MGTIGVMLAAGWICCAQAPEFEAVSVKPARTGVTGRSFTQSPGGRLLASNAIVKMLIAFAYRVMPEQIVGGPSWVESDGFDIEAKAGDPKITQPQFHQMIQGLLTERFHLVVRRATEVVVVDHAEKPAPNWCPEL